MSAHPGGGRHVLPFPAGPRVEAHLAIANRETIEAEIERLIGLLDTADPDPDLEPEDDYCLAGDDGCGPTRALQGGMSWGCEKEALADLLPRYGIDQSRGPINLREFERECRTREMGGLRSTSGGWRRS